MTSPAQATLAELVRNHTAEIVTLWTERTRAAIVSSALDRAELTDHIPTFLDALAQALPAPGTADASKAKVLETAAAHGEHRFRLGFNLRSVALEYGLLWDVLLDLARRQGVLPTHEDLLTLGDAITRAMAEAVSEYTRQRDAELERQASRHVGFIAHEIRNPLGAARTSLELLRRKHGASVPQRLMDVMDRSLSRMNELIERALQISRFTAPLAVEAVSIDVAALVADVIDDSAAEAEDKDLTLRTELAPVDPITGDPQLLRSALTNLVRNAVKFTDRSGVVTVRVVDRDDRIAIEVQDECGGLPEGAVTKAFAPFAQLGKDRTGFGLGLAIAKQAVEAHCGTISVHDLPGKGCLFAVELPRPPKPEGAESEG